MRESVRFVGIAIYPSDGIDAFFSFSGLSGFFSFSGLSGFFSFFGSAGKHPCWIIHSVSVVFP